MTNIVCYLMCRLFTLARLVHVLSRTLLDKLLFYRKVTFPVLDISNHIQSTVHIYVLILTKTIKSLIMAGDNSHINQNNNYLVPYNECEYDKFICDIDPDYNYFNAIQSKLTLIISRKVPLIAHIDEIVISLCAIVHYNELLCYLDTLDIRGGFTMRQMRQAPRAPTKILTRFRKWIFLLRKKSLNVKDIQLHSIKKNAFCLKTSHFINKYDSPRSQPCQWPRLVYNCNQSFNMPRPSVYFDSHQNIPASHLGIPSGIENLELQY